MSPNSNWVNDVRFGYNRYNLADGNAECLGGLFVGKRWPAELYGAGFHFRGESSVSVLRIPGREFQRANRAFPVWARWRCSSAIRACSKIPTRHTTTFPIRVAVTNSSSGLSSITAGSGDWRSRFSRRRSQYLTVVASCQRRIRHTCSGSTDLQDFLAGNIGNGNQILVNPQQEIQSSASTAKRFILRMISG